MFVVREEMKAGDGKVVLPWVTVFFSNIGAERYIEDNRHNLQNPHVYVASGYDNDEWQAVRSMILEPQHIKQGDK